MTKYKILDWAGNECITPMLFNTFKDAWNAIYDQLDELDDAEFDAEADKYTVIPVTLKGRG